MPKKEQLPYDQAERAILGIDHQEIGALLLQEWNIPEPIVEAVRWHHEPSAYEGDRLVVDLIHVAEMLTWETDIGAGAEGENYRIDDQAAQRLELDDTVHETIVETMVAELEKFRDVLKSESAASSTSAYG